MQGDPKTTPSDPALDVIVEQGNRTNQLLELVVEGLSKAPEEAAEVPEGKTEFTFIGKKGDKGDRGEKGDPGKDADEVKIFESVWEKIKQQIPVLDDVVEALKPFLQKGDKGDPGERGLPGKDSDPKEVAAELKKDKSFLESVRGKQGLPGPQGGPDTAADIVKKINESGEMISADRIVGLFKTPQKEGGMGPASKTYSVSEMEDVVGEPEDGQVLVYSSATRAWRPTTLSSGSFTVLQKTAGNIDDSNVVFTFGTASEEPQFLVINGAWYPTTGGSITWSWNNATKEATLSSPIGGTGSIFAIQ